MNNNYNNDEVFLNCTNKCRFMVSELQSSTNNPEKTEFLYHPNDPNSRTKYQELINKTLNLTGFFSVGTIATNRTRSDLILLTGDSYDEFGFKRLDLTEYDGKHSLDIQNINMTTKTFTDTPIIPMALHPVQPIIYHIQQISGSMNCSIHLLNYESKEERQITEELGWINFLYYLSDEELIAIVFQEKENVIFRISIESGEKTKLLSTQEQIMSATCDYQSQRLIAALGRSETKLLMIDFSSNYNIEYVVTLPNSLNQFPRISPNGEMIAFICTPRQSNPQLVIYDIKTERELIRKGIPGNSIGFFISDTDYMQWDDDHRIFASVCKDGDGNVFVFDLETETWNGPMSRNTVLFDIISNNFGVFWPSISNNGTVEIEGLFKNESDVKTMYEFPRETTFECTKESITYTSFDGHEIQGWLTRNIENDGAPLIVSCHGGPTTVDFKVSDPFVEILVQAGYHVFQPNYRGSTTFGTEHQDLLKGEMGKGEILDVIYGTRHLCESLNLTSKPVIMGGSYGGFISLMAIGKEPNLWSGCVSIAPVADIIKHYELGNSHYKQFYQTFIGVSYEENPDIYYKRSPITYLGYVRSPLLILGGEMDPHSYFPQIESYYKKAQELEKEVFFITHDKGHSFGNQEEMENNYCEILAFLEALKLNDPQASSEEPPTP